LAVGRCTVLTLIGLFVCAAASAQTVQRRATNIAALLAYPGFYHTRPIVIVGTVALNATELRVSDGTASIHVIFKGASTPDGLDEIRGEFWDVGRMKPDDPRLAGYDLRATFHMDPDAPWPRPGEVTAIIATSVAPASPPQTPTIRALVLEPSHYLDQKVTISGQFGGRNLLGDLPDAPAQSRYDFVLRSGDAAIWVIHMRPKGKDRGKDFELSVDARIDTGRWLQVSGTLQQGRGLLWIDADAGSLEMIKPPTETAVADEPIRVAAAPPPEVVFSAPTQDETDVSMGASVRIQFSRDLNPDTIKNHVRVSYLVEQSVERGEPATPQAEFTTKYLPANRVLQITFAKPLERFRTVKIELLDGILGTDQQPLKPWTLTFAVGGS
jgi:hypothetical protein